MTLSPNTKVHDLLLAHPFLEDFLVSRSPKFEMLKNRMARATVGRVATLKTAAGIASLDLETLLQSVAAEIESKTGARPEVAPVAPGQGLNRQQRLQVLKEVIGELHRGGDPARARERFAEAVEDVEASEVAAMEEELIRGGLPVSEVQRLCDVHVGTLRQALDGHAAVEVPPGHPVDTYTRANRVVTRLANELGSLARDLAAGSAPEPVFASAARVLAELGGLENHYQRKENQLFAMLERHRITGPSQVMWGVHDQIRAALKATREACAAKDEKAFAAKAPALARDLIEMVYKEEKILFPMSMQTLSEPEWIELRRGEDVLGYGFVPPAAPWPATADATPPEAAPLLDLMTGLLSVEQLNLLFSHLPVDVSFVDEHDTVRFYSEGPGRIFPRSPAAIGRRVQHCHPPKSVHIVQDILDSFRAGTQSVAEFWIQLHGRFLHIRYLAMRDRAGAYRGCLEVTQDVTAIRKLEGERRLLSWESATAKT